MKNLILKILAFIVYIVFLFFMNLYIFRSEIPLLWILSALGSVLYAHNNIHKIIINTDSLNATRILERDKLGIRKYIRMNNSDVQKLQSAYTKILHESRNNVTIEFRHVKAHTLKEDARSFVNKWCDSEAKKRMWSKINNN